MDKTAARIHAGVTFHTEMPLVSLFRLVHLGILLFSAFLVELGALISVASAIVPPRIIRPAPSREMISLVRLILRERGSDPKLPKAKIMRKPA